VISGGFQNFQHMLYGLPNGWLVRNVDTSDILDRYTKRRKKREEELLEEQIAAQLLQKRAKKVEIPEWVSTVKIEAVLRSKMVETPAPGEVEGAQRQKRIRLLLLAIMMDD